VFGETSNKVITNLSQHDVIVGRLLKWSKEPFSIHAKGIGLLNITACGKDLGMYTRYILQQKWRRKPKSTFEKFPPG